MSIPEFLTKYFLEYQAKNYSNVNYWNKDSLGLEYEHIRSIEIAIFSIFRQLEKLKSATEHIDFNANSVILPCSIIYLRRYKVFHKPW